MKRSKTCLGVRTEDRTVIKVVYITAMISQVFISFRSQFEYMTFHIFTSSYDLISINDRILLPRK